MILFYRNGIVELRTKVFQSGITKIPWSKIAAVVVGVEEYATFYRSLEHVERCCHCRVDVDPSQPGEAETIVLPIRSYR